MESIKTKIFTLVMALALLALAACSDSTSPSINEATSPSERVEFQEETSSNQSAPPLSSASQPQSEENQFLSISMSGNINGTPVEKTFTDSSEMEKIASLIVDQETLEDTSGLEIPNDVIVATIQDGPGTNFKLTLFPAKVPALNANVLVIQGELFTFYTDIQAYETITDMLE